MYVPDYKYVSGLLQSLVGSFRNWGLGIVIIKRFVVFSTSSDVHINPFCHSCGKGYSVKCTHIMRLVTFSMWKGLIIWLLLKCAHAVSQIPSPPPPRSHTHTHTHTHARTHARTLTHTHTHIHRAHHHCLRCSGDTESTMTLSWSDWFEWSRTNLPSIPTKTTYV